MGFEFSHNPQAKSLTQLQQAWQHIASTAGKPAYILAGWIFAGAPLLRSLHLRERERNSKAGGRRGGAGVGSTTATATLLWITKALVGKSRPRNEASFEGNPTIYSIYIYPKRKRGEPENSSMRELFLKDEELSFSSRTFL